MKTHPIFFLIFHAQDSEYDQLFLTHWWNVKQGQVGATATAGSRATNQKRVAVDFARIRVNHNLSFWKCSSNLKYDIFID